MAIVASLVVLLLIGTLDMGYAVYASNTLAEAVRGGARYAAVHGADSPSPVGPTANSSVIESVVLSYAPGIPAGHLTVTSTWPDGSNSYGNRVTVAATYNYPFVVGSFFGKSAIPLRATTTMEISH